MTPPKNNQEFYSQIDETCKKLRHVGMSDEGDELWMLLHDIPWTTTSELFRELETALDKILNGPNKHRLSDEVRAELQEYVNILNDLARSV
jgi:hypothetical protein